MAETPNAPKPGPRLGRGVQEVIKAAKAGPPPDLSGGYRYLKLERMAYYVHKDTYRNALLKMIDRKAEGEEIVLPEEPEGEKAQVVDLLAALEASVEAAKKAKSSKKPTKKAAAKAS